MDRRSSEGTRETLRLRLTATNGGNRSPGVDNLNKNSPKATTTPVNKIAISNSNEDIRCQKCRKDVHEKGLMCDMCETWIHNKCSKTTMEAYKTFSTKSKNYLWFCGDCKKKVKLHLKEWKSVETNQNKSNSPVNNEVKEQEMAEQVFSYQTGYSIHNGVGPR